MTKLLKWIARTPRCDDEAPIVFLDQRSLRVCGLAMGMALLASAPAQADDGCQVLLCLAAPNWRSIPQCVPPVTQMLRDVARGKPFPACAMSGAGNSASHRWSSAPSFCPPQYTRAFDGPNGPIHRCDYQGAISVSLQGTLFARTWWSDTGDTVTEFSPTAQTQLGTWDPRFEADHAAWLASQPARGSN